VNILTSHASTEQISLISRFPDITLLGLTFIEQPIHPAFQPIAGYPKRLCLFNNVQLDPQFQSLPKQLWSLSPPELPIFDMLYLGVYALQLTIKRLQPPKKPPYWSHACHYSNNISTNAEKRCYLVALVSGKTGTPPIPFSENSSQICIDSGASVTVSNNKDDFVEFQPNKDMNLSRIATGLPINGMLNGKFLQTLEQKWIYTSERLSTSLLAR
jgi:hypothetical protein